MDMVLYQIYIRRNPLMMEIEKAVDIPLENRASSCSAAACVLQIHQFLLLLTILNKLSYDRFSLQENKSLVVLYDKTVCTYLFSVSKSYRSIRQRKLSNHAKLRVQRDVTCLAVCALHCLYLLYFHDFSINQHSVGSVKHWGTTSCSRLPYPKRIAEQVIVSLSIIFINDVVLFVIYTRSV